MKLVRMPTEPVLEMPEWEDEQRAPDWGRGSIRAGRDWRYAVECWRYAEPSRQLTRYFAQALSRVLYVGTLPELSSMAQPFLWSRVGQSMQEISETEALHYDMLELACCYHIDKWDDVTAFLKPRTYLVEPLKEAYVAIRTHFGPSPRLVLKFARDLEEEGFEELLVYIEVDMAPEEARSRLSMVDDEWLPAQSSEVLRRVNINLRYV